MLRLLFLEDLHQHFANDTKKIVFLREADHPSQRNQREASALGHCPKSRCTSSFLQSSTEQKQGQHPHRYCVTTQDKKRNGLSVHHLYLGGTREHYFIWLIIETYAPLRSPLAYPSLHM